jgi:hypothetical protein
VTAILEQLEAVAARQYPDDEVGRLQCLVELLKTKLMEVAYAAQKESA